MVKLLFNLYYWFAFFVVTLVGLAVLPLILLVNWLFYSRSTASGLRRAIRFYGWVLVCLVPFISPVRVEYAGEKLPVTAIFVANHNSAIDPYLFGAIGVENGFVTSWPFRIPVYNYFMRLAGYANTDEGWDAVRKKCFAMLAAGSSVTIWPEGHRSRDGRLGRFKNGAFSLAVETGTPIVPVCIIGSGKVLPPGRRMLSPGKIRLIVLNPVYPEMDLNGYREDAVRDLKIKVREIIENTLAQSEHSQGLVAEQRI